MDKNELIIPELNNETIESMIYIIRGQKVMLDFELAKIYGYETKNFNRQVKNNIEKFPDEFRFELTRADVDIISKCKNFTSMPIMQVEGIKGGRTSLPWAFTEQGVYMLMTVLKGDLATKQSISLVKAFKSMKDYIIESNYLLLNSNSYIESRLSSYDKRFETIENKLEIVMDNFIDPNTYKHYLIKDGYKIEADIAYQSIYKLAKSSIYIIDDYIDIKTLQLLKSANKNINIVIISDNRGDNNLNKIFFNEFINETKFNIKFLKNNKMFHSRFIIIDFNTDNEIIYLCGGSSKDSGKRINAIQEITEKELYKDLINEILNNDELIIY